MMPLAKATAWGRVTCETIQLHVSRFTTATAFDVRVELRTLCMLNWASLTLSRVGPAFTASLMRRKRRVEAGILPRLVSLLALRVRSGNGTFRRREAA